MNWVTWINTAVGIIGIIVGIIGWKSLSAATKIKNSIKTGDASNIQQAQVIHNGLDDYAVIRLSRETTQEELKKAIELLQPMSWGELDDMVTERVNQTLDERIATTEEIEEMLKPANKKSSPKQDLTEENIADSR